MKKNLGSILLGAPGSGKGTQAKRLSAYFSIPHISTGDILRSEIQRGTELGKRVQEIVAEGKLVSNSLVTEVVRKRFQEKDVERGYVLDGFPRTVPQAAMLGQILEERTLPDSLVLFIDLPERLLVSRLIGRLSCSQCGAVFHKELNPPKKELTCDLCGAHPLSQRKDDDKDTVLKRLDVFESETTPLLKFYSKKGRLQKIDGSFSVEEVFKILRKKISP